MDGAVVNVIADLTCALLNLPALPALLELLFFGCPPFACACRAGGNGNCCCVEVDEREVSAPTIEEGRRGGTVLLFSAAAGGGGG